MFRVITIVCTLIACLPGTGTAQPTEGTPVRQLFEFLVGRDAAVRDRAAEILGRRDDPSVVPALLEAARYVPPGRGWRTAMKNLTGKSFGADWNRWMEWLGGQHLEPHPGYLEFKISLLEKVDPNFNIFFRKGTHFSIRPELITWGGVKFNGIPALHYPAIVPGALASYLTDEEAVFGVTLNGISRAYPLRILDWHEMVNDTVGGISVTLAYCTLCGSAILFDTTVGDAVFTFGSSGLLYESNKLMYDRQTQSLWTTLHGTPVVGPLASREMGLRRLPIVRTRWKTWKADHPSATVLSLTTGFTRDYTPGAAYGEYFASDETMFPVSRRDDILRTKEWIFGLLVDSVAKAYPLNRLDQTLLHDSVNGKGILLISGPDELSVRAYERKSSMVFRRRDDTTLVDEDNRTWYLHEESLRQSESGQELRRLGGHLAYWFGWYAFFPETLIYTP